MENHENTTTNETVNTETEAKPSKEPKTPAWQLFHAALDAEIKALGLEQEEQKNYVQVLHAETGQRIYIAKQDRAVTHVPTTMPLGNDLPGCSVVEEGTNGKIAAQIAPDIETVREALKMLAKGSYGKVRASKRKAKAETVTESVELETASAE